MVSIPFMQANNKMAKENYNIRLENYYRSGRMLVKLAEALGRISLAGREMTRLAGFTERVTQIINVIDDLNRGHYKRTMVKNEPEYGKASQNEELKPNSGEIIYQDNIIKYFIIYLFLLKTKFI